MTKSELMNLIIGLPYGETNYKVVFKNGTIGNIDHCKCNYNSEINTENYSCIISTENYGCIYFDEYREDLTNKIENRFDIVKIIQPNDCKIINYEELINKISGIKKSIIDLQDTVIYDAKLWNYLEESNNQLRECKEYINNKIFEEFCKEEETNK